MTYANHLNKNLFTKQIETETTRQGYGEGLLEEGKNKKIIALTGDLTESTKTHLFAEKYPERFIETGVAEQNMMGIAAGLAIEGKIPIIASYAVFNPGRNWDQLRVSVCYTNANVKIIGAHAGISVGPDGATHQALEDIAITRVLPNLTVLSPCDKHETKKAIKNAITTKISFVTFGGIPLITYLTATYILPFQKLNLLLATITTILSLTILGIIKAKINKENPIKNTTERIIIGTIAALAAFIIGHTISTIIGTNLY